MDEIRGLDGENDEKKKNPGTRKKKRNMYNLHVMFIWRRQEPFTMK